MKISFMTFACPEWSLDEVIDAAGRYGYHGVEFRCDAKHAHGLEVYIGDNERKAIARKLEKADIEICCLATSLQFAREVVHDEAPARIKLAADLGCPALRVFCGPPPTEMDDDTLIRTVAENLRAIATLAEQSQVQLWLETHDRMSKATLAAPAVRMANHPNVGLNYDNMHPYRQGEPLETTLAQVDGLVRHTHFHDAINAPDKVIVTPFGKGQMPLDEMFTGLLDMGYDGYISGEWFRDMYGAQPDDALERFYEDVATLAEKHGVRIAR